MSLESAEPAFAAVARLTAELFFELGESKVMEALIQAPRAAGSPLLQLDEALGTRLSLGTKQVAAAAPALPLPLSPTPLFSLSFCSRPYPRLPPPLLSPLSLSSIPIPVASWCGLSGNSRMCEDGQSGYPARIALPPLPRSTFLPSCPVTPESTQTGATKALHFNIASTVHHSHVLTIPCYLQSLPLPQILSRHFRAASLASKSVTMPWTNS